MTAQELFEFLKENLSIELTDASEPSRAGGDIPASYGVRARLLLTNPATGKKEVIDEDKTLLE